MVSQGFKAAGSIVSVLIIVAAYLYNKRCDELLQERVHKVLSGLLRAENKIPLPKTRVAIGFGACYDVFGNAIEIFNKLNITPPKEPKHFNTVGNIKELAQLLAYFFQYGAAAERYVGNRTLFDELVRTADSLPNKRWIIGGNAAMMAQRMAMEGVEVMLGARLTKSMASSLDSSIKVAGKESDKEIVHLLMEYETGATWGKYESPRANRLILHSDYLNPYLESMKEFREELKQFDPSLVVVGGLQMMDNFPFTEGMRQARLQMLESVLAGVPLKTKIHFELASFTDVSLLDEIHKHVLLYSDSLGMNEQELPNLVSLLYHGNVSLVSDSYPRIATVLDQMRQVYSLLGTTKQVNGRRRLTRLHVHTLAYQVILTSKLSSWKNTMSATAKAALTAHRHVCGTHNIDEQNAKLIVDYSFSSSQSESSKRIEFRDKRPVSCWDEADYEICIAPVLVCTKVFVTSGGGDNISSAGLVLQL
ncbi:ADP-dependent glucokinase-like [Gigantopelta aegis]|uniref:ADP-dependent glucokinase-like n=1 Tax=Gigantopelta aegis TaxID=1735272 RepID=UPI001B8873E0|nr:ADP-dependent glucokinase-like [Gigantopelta aegis]